MKVVSYEICRKELLNYYGIENRTSQNSCKFLKEELIKSDEEDPNYFRYSDSER